MSDGETEPGRGGQRARRRAVRDVIAAYHKERLRGWLERLREGCARLDAGEIDVLELDDLIHRSKRSGAELWKFCASSAGEWERAARGLAYLGERGEDPDWWEGGASIRRPGRPG